MPLPITLYRFLTSQSGWALQLVLAARRMQGKEEPSRIAERFGIANHPRPQGPLLWVHAASVGEAQSALIVINRLLAENPALHILMTTGTRTSARLMSEKLPARAFHQFVPVDHPIWVRRFLDYWRPDAALWMESEIWPNMIMGLKACSIPAALLNARLSENTFRLWQKVPRTARILLDGFQTILCQNAHEAARFAALGVQGISVTGNLKYSAAPLNAVAEDLNALKNAIGKRPVWIFASTHAGEEELAAAVHREAEVVLPQLLTIIIPRHPKRGDTILKTLGRTGLHLDRRGEGKNLPDAQTQIYLADTMGELGLFYTLAPLACIGRSFSDDGGGGHNPIEAAQLGCYVLHGPNVQFQRQIYAEMNEAQAAQMVEDKAVLADRVISLLRDAAHLQTCRARAQDFVQAKVDVIEIVMQKLNPLITHLRSSTAEAERKSA
ncbi:MAG: 3-deoxy-D-manno-octulosonic acid transferase [Alphaproteobacteria bacterium]|nr:3-deoxy-D-manno-octulosonic acid transferase [Alphaproteobacteria bacterium]